MFRQYYETRNGSKNDLAGVEFLRDCVRYLDNRNECLNEGKTFIQLISDFSKKIEFDKSNRF
jgi:hypothetical protein